MYAARGGVCVCVRVCVCACVCARVCACVCIDYRIQGLETVKITELIRISRFRKLCTWPGHFCELCRENSRYI